MVVDVPATILYIAHGIGGWPREASRFWEASVVSGVEE
jgi:hypothetical protein